MPKNKKGQPANIFDAVYEGNIDALKQFLQQSPDLAAVNPYGFTALHCAAMASNQLDDEAVTLESLKLLVEAGSPLETKSRDGRTALYLLAEFSPYLSPVQYLVGAGANPDVSDQHGNHIVENAMDDDVQAWLSSQTGAEKAPVEPGPEEVKMSAAAWKKARAAVSVVFAALSEAGLVALEDAGYTQSDAFSDCSEIYHERGGQQAVKGFCFYTRQDQDTAKRTSQLYLGIWGAPEGADDATIEVGKTVVDIFAKHGFDAFWKGDAGVRPAILLHRFND